MHTRVTLLGARESTVSCVPVFCVLPAFRACVSSRVTVRCSNLQFILAVPEDGTQICKHCVCQHWPCRFSFGTFFEGVCCLRFLTYCDLSVFASLLDVYRSRHQTLEGNWNCALGHTCKLCSLRGCWHRERLLSLYRVLCWRPGYFVSLTMGCVVVTEPFDLTVLVEGTRSTLQIGCKPILAASAIQDGWTHS